MQDPHTQEQQVQQGPKPIEGDGQEVDIPATALVHCPLVGFKLRAVQACTSCPHFDGLVDRFPGSPSVAAFVGRYRVACRQRPVYRDLQELA